MSLGGQSGTTQTTSQQNSNVNMGPWLNQQGPLQGLFDSAVNLYNNNGLNAPTNSNQTAGANATAQLGSGTNAAVNAGNNTLTNYINGSMLSPTSNPYLSGMENAAAQQVTNQYQTATAPQTASQFELANRNGSGAALQAQNQNQLGLGNTLNNLANTFYGNAYNQGTNQQLQASSLAPSLNQAQYINPSALLSAGNTQQQQLLNQQLQPWQSAQLYQGLISGNYGQNGSTNTYSTQQTPYYSNPLGSALGGVMGGLGVAGQLGWQPFGAASGMPALGSIAGSAGSAGLPSILSDVGMFAAA